MKALNQEEESFEIPMTPMIDIVFQLLIFFLLATTISEEEIDIRVNIPTGSQGSPAGTVAGSRLVIGVRKDGTATLGGAPITWPELRKRLLDEGRRKEKPRVELRGDGEAIFAKIAEAFQLCTEAGLETINVKYRPEVRAPKP